MSCLFVETRITFLIRFIKICKNNGTFSQAANWIFNKLFMLLSVCVYCVWCIDIYTVKLYMYF